METAHRKGFSMLKRFFQDWCFMCLDRNQYLFMHVNECHGIKEYLASLTTFFNLLKTNSINDVLKTHHPNYNMKIPALALCKDTINEEEYDYLMFVTTVVFG